MQGVVLERLAKNEGSAASSGLAKQILRALSGHHADLDLAAGKLPDGLQKLKTRHARHVPVGDDEVGAVLIDERQGIGSCREGVHARILKTNGTDGAGQDGLDGSAVIDDDDARRHETTFALQQDRQDESRRLEGDDMQQARTGRAEERASADQEG